ncbi:MAG: alpha-L-glutamate ligase, partial [Candidatus Fonsibacter ubiquis]|nr:alpha-L-glutamate ligase [Candidatus Fonsibacter ubiquis]
MKAYIIHENDEWTLPLKENLQKLSVPFEDWHMAKVNLNTASNPPEGVFYNRMSASSHSRGHRFAPEYTAVILNWLSSHKRRIINNESAKYVRGSQFEESVDGITILQEYIEADPKVVTRVEFIDSKFFYAVQVDASDSFELCPADACNIEEQFCPTNPDGNKFMIVKNYQNPLIANYEKFLKANHIEVAGIEYMLDKQGNAYTYDVNTNT